MEMEIMPHHAPLKRGRLLIKHEALVASRFPKHGYYASRCSLYTGGADLGKRKKVEQQGNPRRKRSQERGRRKVR